VLAEVPANPGSTLSAAPPHHEDCGIHLISHLFRYQIPLVTKKKKKRKIVTDCRLFDILFTFFSNS